MGLAVLVIVGAWIVFIASKSLIGFVICSVLLIFVKDARKNAEKAEFIQRLLNARAGLMNAFCEIPKLTGLDANHHLRTDVEASIVNVTDPYIKVVQPNSFDILYFLSELKLSIVDGHKIYYVPGEIAFFFFKNYTTTIFVFKK